MFAIECANPIAVFFVDYWQNLKPPSRWRYVHCRFRTNQHCGWSLHSLSVCLLITNKVTVTGYPEEFHMPARDKYLCLVKSFSLSNEKDNNPQAIGQLSIMFSATCIFIKTRMFVFTCYNDCVESIIRGYLYKTMLKRRANSKANKSKRYLSVG